MTAQYPRSPYIIELYDQYLVDHDAGSFVKGVSSRYSPVTLERLACRGRRLVRRSAILALGYVGQYESNATLGRALMDPDRGARTLAEKSIRNVWCRIGTERQRKRLYALIVQNESKRYAEAVGRATELIHESPWLAEAWNQRGVANFHLCRFDDALRDYRQALEINNYHFNAAAGIGHCHLKLGDQVAALNAFRQSLQINPSMEDVRLHVSQLQRSVQDEGPAS